MAASSYLAEATAIVNSFVGRGFTLTRDGSDLVIQPADLVLPDEIALLRATKRSLLKLRGCPVYGCGQLLPWGELDTHTCTPLTRSRSQKTGTR